MTRRLLVALLVVLAGAGAAGCGGGDDEGGRDRAKEREEREDRETTTSTTESTESTATTGVPDTPEEWMAVVEEFWERYEALDADPDPAKVRDLYAEECPCYETRHFNVQEIADAGWHIVYDQSRPLVLSVTPVQIDEGGQALLNVAYLPRPYDVLDGDGKVIQHMPVADETPVCAQWHVLPDGRGGAYRIHSEEPVTGCPEVGG